MTDIQKQIEQVNQVLKALRSGEFAEAVREQSLLEDMCEGVRDVYGLPRARIEVAGFESWREDRVAAE